VSIAPVRLDPLQQFQAVPVFVEWLIDRRVADRMTDFLMRHVPKVMIAK